MLEAAGQGMKTIWAGLVRMFYDKIVVAGNLCSIGVLVWILGQVSYNGSKILDAPKGQAFKLGIATILRAFCCGIAAFIVKAKYEDAMRASKLVRDRGGSGRDEEEPMDTDPSPEDTLQNFYTQPGVSGTASVIYSSCGAKKGDRITSQL